MPNSMKLEQKRSIVTSKSTSGHETAYSAINSNVLNSLISLREIEKAFYTAFTELESANELADYEPMYEKFYSSFSDMLEALKALLAETTEINIGKLISTKTIK